MYNKIIAMGAVKITIYLIRLYFFHIYICIYEH